MGQWLDAMLQTVCQDSRKLRATWYITVVVSMWGLGDGRVRLKLTSWACDPCAQKGPAFEVECFAVAAAVFSVRSDGTGAYLLRAQHLGSCVLISQPLLWFVSKPGPLLLPLLDLPLPIQT